MRAILVVLFMGLCHPPCFAQAESQTGITEGSPLEEDSGAVPEREGRGGNQYSLPVRIIEAPPESQSERDRVKKSEERDDADLEAQTDMAVAAKEALKFARWQTLVAGGGVMVAAIGTVGLFWTVCLTRRQVNDQWRIHIEQTRPFLRFEGDVTAEVRNGPGGRYLVLHYEVENIGQSPAVNVRGHFKLCLPLFVHGSAKDTADFAASCIDEMGTTQQFIPQNETREFRHSGNKPAAIPDEGFNGWLVFFGVTYQRGGHDEVYYIARQLRIEPADARRAFNRSGIAKVKARIISGVDAAK